MERARGGQTVCDMHTIHTHTVTYVARTFVHFAAALADACPMKRSVCVIINKIRTRLAFYLTLLFFMTTQGSSWGSGKGWLVNLYNNHKSGRTWPLRKCCDLFVFVECSLQFFFYLSANWFDWRKQHVEAVEGRGMYSGGRGCVLVRLCFAAWGIVCCAHDA